jgi:hypothetical protein
MLFGIFFAIAWSVLFLAFTTKYFSTERVKKYARNLLLSMVSFILALLAISAVSLIDKLF